MSFQVYQAQGLRIFAGNTATCANYTGNEGEISVNTETKAVYVHDGLTPGGTPLTTAEQVELLGMTLGQLANVELDTPSDGQVLVYDEDAGVWKNELVAGAGGGAVNLDGLNDVDLVNPADNQVLTYNQGLSKWENKEVPQADLSTEITSPQDGDTLVYSASQGKWLNQAKFVKPSFYAMGSGDYTATDGADFPFTRVIQNIGNCYNGSNSRFTASMSGVYMFSYNLFVKSGSGRSSFKLNGSSIHAQQNYYQGGHHCASSMTIHLNAGDYITVGDWQNYSGSVEMHAGHSHFSGAFLH